MKILIVEDEVLIREGMSDYLMECGYDIFEAGDGKEALDLFYREIPDLVLLISSSQSSMAWKYLRPSERLARSCFDADGLP